MRRFILSTFLAFFVAISGGVPAAYALNNSVVAATAALAADTALYNGGTLVWYSGTQPATPETALSGNTVLATFTFSATAFGSATFSGGFVQQTASFVSNTVATPAANGTATFARAYKSDGTTVIADYTIGTSGTDIVVGNTTVSTTIQLQMTSLVMKMPAS